MSSKSAVYAAFVAISSQPPKKIFALSYSQAGQQIIARDGAGVTWFFLAFEKSPRASWQLVISEKTKPPLRASLLTLATLASRVICAQVEALLSW